MLIKVSTLKMQEGKRTTWDRVGLALAFSLILLVKLAPSSGEDKSENLERPQTKDITSGST